MSDADARVVLPPGTLIKDQAARMHVLDDALASGIADAEAGRVRPIGEAFALIRSRLANADEAMWSVYDGT